MNTSEFIEKAIQIHNGKYDYSQTTYVNSRTKVTIICPKHGSFEQKAVSHLQGSGCPKCARVWSDEHRKNLQKSSRASRGMTTEEWIERAKKIHGDKYDYSQTVYVNQRTNVKIICPKHGLFEQKADSHIRGYGCRLCGLESEKRKFSHEWSDAQRQKIAATCMARYGAPRYLDSEEGKKKNAETRARPEFRKKMRDIISSDEVQTKIMRTCELRYGVPFATQLEEITDKVNSTKIKRGTWNTSRPEEKMYVLLCDHFGSDDVVRQYKEVRYPFHCDFYVKSLDLFIELNASWVHGGHWFDSSNPEDIAKVQDFQSRLANGKRFYEVALRIWTDRDVLKRDTAIRNNLRYLVFWNNNLDDFKSWLSADELLLNNVI